MAANTIVFAYRPVRVYRIPFLDIHLVSYLSRVKRMSFPYRFQFQSEFLTEGRNFIKKSNFMLITCKLFLRALLRAKPALWSRWYQHPTPTPILAPYPPGTVFEHLRV